MSAAEVIKALKGLASSSRAENSARFFKTKKGEYGAGDQFIGVAVPEQRTVAKKFSNLSRNEIKKLLRNRIHEYRCTALLILVSQYERASKEEKTKIFQFYKQNLTYVNNWDLVDLSAPRIFGDYCLRHNDTRAFFELADSKNLWFRRISIVATYTFIRAGKLGPVERIAKLHLNDTEDLMHKATGWMLREMGKRDEVRLKKFLDTYSSRMPRTMLRYAIERFSPQERKYWLQKDK